jgi:hypothetical protein
MKREQWAPEVGNDVSMDYDAFGQEVWRCGKVLDARVRDGRTEYYVKGVSNMAKDVKEGRMGGWVGFEGWFDSSSVRPPHRL